MKIRAEAFLLLGILAVPGGAMAGAGSGFGLSLGAAAIVSKDSVTEQQYARATVLGAADFQLALGESFSLGIILAEASGDASFPTLPAVTFHKYSMVGLEARVWLGAWFVGYQKGTYVFVTTEGFESPKLSGGTEGDGVLIGVEGEGGWFLVAQTVSIPDVQVPQGPKVDAEGTLLRIGFRWR